MRRRLTAGLALALTAWGWLGVLPATGFGAAAAQTSGSDAARSSGQESGDAGSGEQAPEIAEMTLGAEDAPVEVVEYASYTCPHCQRFHAEVFDRIKANYVDPGDVRFVYREVYFDRPGLWASMLARCRGEERFFAITDMLYERQSDWLGDGEPQAIAENLRRIGRSAGMTPERIQSCMSDAAKAEALVGWYESNAEADEITATPSFVIDGEKHSNMSYEDFSQLLDEKLAGS